MRQLLFGNFGHYLFLFFVIQVHLIIKGSSAFPGNLQGRAHEDSKGDPHETKSDSVVDNQMNEGGNKSDWGMNVNNFEEESDHKLSPPPPPPPSAHELELVAPRARNGNALNHEMTENPDPDNLNYSMIKSPSAILLRPKSISRQSGGYNSGSQTPGIDHDWVDIDSQASEFSSSSRIARMIYSTNSIVTDEKILPISFNFLCSYLEETADKEMGEDELLLICKRLIIETDTFIKALKDLPLFIKNCKYSHNAIKINSILYSYLSQSSELFKDLSQSSECFNDLSNEMFEKGSASSRCSSRGTDSTIESPPNSPVNEDGNYTPSISKIRNASTSPRIEDNNDISSNSVLEEINRVQSHVPHTTHILQSPSYFGNIMYGNHLGYIPQTAYSRIGLRPIQIRSSLYPLQEESKTRTISSEDESSPVLGSNLIEEVD